MPAFPLLDVTDLRDELGSARPPRLIDVRSATEFEVVHIPGSANVPLDRLRERCTDLAACLGQDVVLICRSGKRARQAQQALHAAGRPDVQVLDGGLVAWEAAQGPVRRGHRRWSLERQIRGVTGSIVLGGIVGSVVVPELKWLSAAIGAGLLAAAVTNSCLLAELLTRLPYNQAPACDLDTILTDDSEPS